MFPHVAVEDEAYVTVLVILLECPNRGCDPDSEFLPVSDLLRHNLAGLKKRQVRCQITRKFTVQGVSIKFDDLP